MGAVSIGTGLSGIIVNLIRIIILLVVDGKGDDIFSTLVFFGISAFILLVCAASYSVLIRL